MVELIQAIDSWPKAVAAVGVSFAIAWGIRSFLRAFFGGNP